MGSPADRLRAKEIEEAIERAQWTRARSLIEAWLGETPEDHWLLARFALTYYEQRDYERALQFDIQALQIAPYCPLVVWGYAGDLDMLGRTKEALSIYRWLVSWGEEYLADGPCGEGIRAARGLIADCFYRIALIQEQRHQWKRAIAAYEEHLARRGRGTRSIYPLPEVKRRYKTLLSTR
jgi:tetratricopeptide (TPR) repeat protein